MSCIGDALPFACIEDDEEFKSTIYEMIYGSKFDFHQLDNMQFIPFELNQSHNMPLYEVDPDTYFFHESRFTNNLACDYYVWRNIQIYHFRRA